MVLANLVRGTYHDIVVEYKEEGGHAALQVSLFIGNFHPRFIAMLLATTPFASMCLSTDQLKLRGVVRDHTATRKTRLVRSIKMGGLAPFLGSEVAKVMYVVPLCPL